MIAYLQDAEAKELFARAAERVGQKIMPPSLGRGRKKESRFYMFFYWRSADVVALLLD
jgi:hypothetical protein